MFQLLVIKLWWALQEYLMLCCSVWRGSGVLQGITRTWFTKYKAHVVRASSEMPSDENFFFPSVSLETVSRESLTTLRHFCFVLFLSVILRSNSVFFPPHAHSRRWALERIWKWKAFLSAASRVNSVWQLRAGDIDLYWHNPLFAAESQSESTRGSSAFFNKIRIFVFLVLSRDLSSWLVH